MPWSLWLLMVVAFALIDAADRLHDASRPVRRLFWPRPVRELDGWCRRLPAHVADSKRQWYRNLSAKGLSDADAARVVLASRPSADPHVSSLAMAVLRALAGLVRW